MAKITGPLFSMNASGSFGGIIFDRRGYAYMRRTSRDPRTPKQGNFRQAMTAAQKCAGVCGHNTRQELRALADDPARWSAYLTKQMIGPQRATLLAALAHYAELEADHPHWEEAATGIGLRAVDIPYAEEAGISPGAQLFALASTLFGMGLYNNLGQPDGNAAIWKDSIIS